MNRVFALLSFVALLAPSARPFAQAHVPVEEDRARPGAKGLVELPIRDALAAPLLSHEVARAGLLHWHPTLEAAELAAQASGKPVLLFQLLGKLDEEFC